MKGFFAKANGKRGEIFLYEEIGEGWFGGTTAKSFSDEVKALGKVDAVDIYINSPGGSVFEGVAIYNQIKRMDMKKDVHIDGIAASIASIIAMAGDTITIAANGTMMIHDPWGFALGTADEMRKSAEALDLLRGTLLDTYVARTGGDREQISAWMADETWMNADEALRRGFVTAKTQDTQINASFAMLDKFKNTPRGLREGATDAKTQLARMQKRTMQLNRRASPATA